MELQNHLSKLLKQQYCQTNCSKSDQQDKSLLVVIGSCETVVGAHENPLKPVADRLAQL